METILVEIALQVIMEAAIITEAIWEVVMWKIREEITMELKSKVIKGTQQTDIIDQSLLEFFYVLFPDPLDFHHLVQH